MLGDLFGNFQQKQDEIKKELDQIKLEAISEDGAVKVVVNGNKALLDLVLDPEKLDLNDIDQVQDLIIVTINKAMDMAQEKTSAYTQNAVKEMLPPGLDQLFG